MREALQILDVAVSSFLGIKLDVKHMLHVEKSQMCQRLLLDHYPKTCLVGDVKQLLCWRILINSEKAQWVCPLSFAELADILSQEKKRCLTPKELIYTLGYPCQGQQANALGTDVRNFDDFSTSAVTEMAGSQQCAASVDAFLSLMYNGVAEFIRRGRSSGQEDSDIDIDSDCEVEELRDFLDVPGKGPVWDIVHPNEKQITKYMDPGTVADLYQHYVATRQMFGAAAVSYGTFLKVYKERWQSILKFREKNLFSACELCWHFKNDIANSKTLEERLGQLVKYRQHLAHQYQDRAICWALQELVLDDQSDLVCIQVDGLDQSKFSLPRDPKLRATSSV
ncbi:unnamed protein product [Durusdinium trenchii]